MQGKSPMMKALVGKQENLNEGLKAAIKAAPGKVMEKAPMNMKMESAVKMGMAIKPPKPLKKKSGKTIMKKPKSTRPIQKPVELEPKPIPTVAKKEDKKGGRVSKTWDSPKDLQNATSMVMAKINKAMPVPSAEKKELTAKAKKLLSTGAVGNLDLLMERNKISGDFTSFKGLTVIRK